MEVELIKIAANLGLAAVIAVILLIWKRQDDKRFESVLDGFLKRQEEMIQHLVRVIEANTQAMSDVKIALAEVKHFMEQVDHRLARVEEALARMGGEHGRSFK